MNSTPSAHSFLSCTACPAHLNATFTHARLKTEQRVCAPFTKGHRRPMSYAAPHLTSTFRTLSSVSDSSSIPSETQHTAQLHEPNRVALWPSTPTSHQELDHRWRLKQATGTLPWIGVNDSAEDHAARLQESANFQLAPAKLMGAHDPRHALQKNGGLADQWYMNAPLGTCLRSRWRAW